MDRLSRLARSENMRAIRSAHTRPELAIRSLVHSLGFRFRLHQRGLPGRPDLVLKRLQTVLFVHGCFWHCHSCIDGHVPKSRQSYWLPKLARNQERDNLNKRALRGKGWRVITVWECELRKPDRLRRKLLRMLSLADAKTARKNSLEVNGSQ